MDTNARNLVLVLNIANGLCGHLPLRSQPTLQIQHRSLLRIREH